MEHTTPRGVQVAPSAFYVDALRRLEAAGIDCLVGGAFAFSHYSKIARETKDFDVFLRPADVPRALALFDAGGYRTEMPFPHWLGKVHCDGAFIDLIFSSGNGVATVDDLWFDHAVTATILGTSMRLSPPEEMIWSKAYIQERERFDGAEVLHLFRELGPGLDWTRLLMRFGDHWPVLFSHVVLFGFVYPDRRDRIPRWVIEELARRQLTQAIEAGNHVCNGTLLSREQYLFDVEQLGYRDGRVEPDGPMTREQTDIWTAAIGRKR